MKTLKQHLANNSIYLTDEILKRIQKAVNEYNKEWLTQKRQECKTQYDENFKIVINELLEELSDNGITEGKK